MSWTPPERPRWVHRLIAHGDAVGGARRLVSLEPEELLATAQGATGLADFGPGDWHEHFDVLLDALERESELHLAGRLLARTEIVRSLGNRLRLSELWQRRPEILAERVHPPVFVIGSPRTGTSILHELLALDPANRAPAMWEMLYPAEAAEGTAPRAAADETVQFWHDLQPEYETMHANSGDLPNECIFITMNEFVSDHWAGSHVVPSYDAHLHHADHRDAYRLHRRVLATLQQRARGERWVLKAPSHLSQLAALFAVYPEARIVHIHRDPLKTVPSAISLLGTLKWMRCARVDLDATAALVPRGFALMFRAEIEQRASGALPEERFVDVLYHDLMRDPVGAIRGLYARLGWPFPEGLGARVTHYLATKPRHAHGVHSYTPEGLGLDAARERERFRFYTDRFGVPEEA